jgi:glycosyltransferase involved in cell wall biosynthesis
VIQKQHKTKVTICVISGSYPPILDGVGEYTEKLLGALKTSLREAYIFLITSALNTVLHEENEDHVFRIIKKWNMKSLVVMLGIIRQKRPKIVHVQYPTIPYGRNVSINLFPFLVKCFFPYIKIISTIHEFSARTKLGKVRLLLDIALSDRIIIVDHNYQEAIGKYLPFKKKRMEFIPVGANILPQKEISPDKITDTRTSLGLKDSDIILCYFGIIRPGKGIGLLLEALNEVTAKNTNIKMFLIGRYYDSYYNDHVTKAVHNLNLQNKAMFTGPCDDKLISRYLGISDICILPFAEGVSTKRTTFMTAVQHKLPIITTRSETLPQGLVDYENVLLFKYGDRRALVNKIFELIENRKLRSKLSKNTERLSEMFSWENIARKTISVYYSVLAKG